MSKTRNEDWRTIEFCPELRGCSVNCDNVAALLADNLFAGNLKVRELFSERYRQMRKNYSDDTRDDGKGVPHDDERWDLKLGTETFERDGNDEAALLSVPQCALPGFPSRIAELWNHANFGLDMPTWMVKSGVENPRRVMIVARDPRRTGYPAGNLLLSTPFGFHSEDYRAIGCQNSFIYNLVWRLLDKSEACVYLTDCIKFYTNDGKDGDLKKKGHEYVLSNRKEFWKTFETTFEAEIKAFKPNVVLTLGIFAAEICGIESPQNGFYAQEVCGRKYVASYHSGFHYTKKTKTYIDRFAKSKSEYLDLIANEVNNQVKGLCS